MTPRTPAEVQPVSAHIREEMQARGWDTKRMVIESMIPISVFVPLMESKLRLQPWVAGRLAKAFGTSVELWLNLDRRHQEWVKNKEQV